MIEVRGVSKSFGSQVVLDRLDLEIPNGETTAIVGPSGVGKSVLMKIIMGILVPDAGEVLIDGTSITACSSEAERNEIRRALGVLFQAAALFDSFTVYQNVAFPLQERTELSREEIHHKVLNLLNSLSLTPFIDDYPEELSIGMRKRVGLARALIMEPNVLLIDEPNTGLDPRDGQEVYDLIRTCKERFGFAGVVISHELPEVFQVSDKVAMLLGGKKIFEGTPEEMINCDQPAVQQFLYGRIDGPIRIQ